MNQLRAALEKRIEKDAIEFSKRGFEIWKRQVEKSQDPTTPVMSDIEHYKACGKSMLDLIEMLDQALYYAVEYCDEETWRRHGRKKMEEARTKLLAWARGEG